MSEAMSSAAQEGAKNPPKKRAPRKPYCDQCKERRVICDMAKPACSRCVKRGRSCYYAPFPAPGSKKSPSGSDTRAGTPGRSKADATLPVIHPHLHPQQRHQTPIDLLGSDLQPGPSVNLRTAEFTGRDPEQAPETLYPLEAANKPDSPAAIMTPAVPDELLTLLFGSSDVTKAFFADNARFHAPGWGPPPPIKPLQVNVAPEEIYANAWVHRLMTAGRVLSRPEGWIEHLPRFRDTELLISGVWACGALEVGHELQAAKYYRRCLELLAPRIKASGEVINFEESVETCACILLLLAYEICNSSLTLHNFNLHLDGLGQILKSHVAYVVKHGKLTQYRMMSPKPDFPGLVYQSFREIESVANLMQGLRPRLSLKEYEMLISVEDCEYATDFEIFKQWNIMHKAATAMHLPFNQRLGALDEIRTAFIRYSWSTPGRKEVAPANLSKWTAVPGLENPFTTSLCYTGQDFQDTLRRTSIALVARSAALRIESSTIDRSLPQSTAEREGRLERAGELVRIAHFCLSEAAIPPFSWLLLGLFCACEMYNLACEPEDRRVAWTKSLLATVTMRMGFTPSKINEYIRSVKSMEGFDLAPMIEPRAVRLPHQLPQLPCHLLPPTPRVSQEGIASPDPMGMRRSSFAESATSSAPVLGETSATAPLGVPLPQINMSPAPAKPRRLSSSSMHSHRSETQPPSMMPEHMEMGKQEDAEGFVKPFHHTHAGPVKEQAYAEHPAPPPQNGAKKRTHGETLEGNEQATEEAMPDWLQGDAGQPPAHGSG